jgi:excisionase family DNA binding protein
VGSEAIGTGEIAKILRVSQRTATKLMDNGTIPGWVVPGSTHRRALKSAVLEVARQMGIAQEAEIKAQPMLSLEEVATAMSKPLPLVKRWAKSGSLPTVTRGNRQFMYQDALLDYANAHNIRLRLE